MQHLERDGICEGTLAALSVSAGNGMDPKLLNGPDNAREAETGFGETFIDDREQRHRRERLAQAARRAEFERHSQKVRRR